MSRTLIAARRRLIASTSPVTRWTRHVLARGSKVSQVTLALSSVAIARTHLAALGMFVVTNVRETRIGEPRSSNRTGSLAAVSPRETLLTVAPLGRVVVAHSVIIAVSVAWTVGLYGTCEAPQRFEPRTRI